MRSQVYEGIETVDQELWDRLTRGYPYAGWRWCRYGEVAVNHRGYYLLAYEGDELVGGAAFFVLHDEIIPTTNPLLRRLLRSYLSWRPLVVTRTATGTDHKGLFLPSDPAQRAGVLEEIRRVAVEITRKHRGSFYMADYLNEWELDYPWGDFFTIRDFTHIGTRMAVEWTTFDEYLAELKARNKKQHKNVRNNTRYAQDLGITVSFAHQTPPVDEVLRLVRIKNEHYKVPFRASDITSIIDGLPMLKEQNVIWVTAHKDGQLAACELLLFDDENRVCKPTVYGRDYRIDYVYFYMSYEDIRYAIEELRAKTIIYDTEAYEFKHRIGFEDDSRNHLVLCPSSPLERKLVGWLMKYMDA